MTLEAVWLGNEVLTMATAAVDKNILRSRADFVPKSGTQPSSKMNICRVESHEGQMVNLLAEI